MTCYNKRKSKQRDNQKWTNQRQWEYWALKTQDKDKHNTTQKTKEISNTAPTTNPEGTQVFMKCKQFLSLSYKTPVMLLIYL